MDALFAAVLVGREGRAGAVGAEEEAGARLAVPQHLGGVGEHGGEADVDGAEARAVVDLQHADVVVLFLPLHVVY